MTSRLYVLVTAVFLFAGLLSAHGAQGAAQGPSGSEPASSNRQKINVTISRFTDLGSASGFKWLERALPELVRIGLQGAGNMAIALEERRDSLLPANTNSGNVGAEHGDAQPFLIHGGFLQYRSSVKVELQVQDVARGKSISLSRVMSIERLLSEFEPFMAELRAELLAGSSAGRARRLAVGCLLGEGSFEARLAKSIGDDLEFSLTSKSSIPKPWVAVPLSRSSRLCGGGPLDRSAIYSELPHVEAILSGAVDITRDKLSVRAVIHIKELDTEVPMFNVAGTSGGYATFQVTLLEKTFEFMNALINADNTWNADLLKIESRDAAGYLELADRASRERNNKDLVAVLLERALEKNPRQPRVLFLLGAARHAQQRYKEAQIYLTSFLKLAPDDPEALEELGDVYSALNLQGDAIASYSRALKVGHEKAELYLKLGQVYYIEENLDQAIQAIHASEGLAPLSAKALTLLGNVYRDKKDEEDATRSYEKALELEPGYKEAEGGLAALYVDQARAKGGQGDWIGARAALEAARKFDKGSVEALGFYAYVLNKLGQYDETVKVARGRATSEATSATLENNIAVALLETEHAEEALAHLDRAIDLDPNQLLYYRNKIETLYLLGREADELAVADLAISRFGPRVDLRVQRASLLAMSGYYEKAWKALDEIDLRDLKAAELADVYNARGFVLGESLRYGESLEWYDKAIAVDGDYYKSYSNKAFTLGELGRYREAVEVADMALKEEPNAYRAMNHKGYSLYQLGDREKGKNLIDEALEKDPKYALGHFNRARLLAAEGSSGSLEELGIAVQLGRRIVRLMAASAREFDRFKESAEFARLMAEEKAPSRE
jgi:superkiller protein 3